MQLTEASFLLGEEQLGAGMVAPVVTPGITNGQDSLFMNNADPASGDQSNCDPLPCQYTCEYNGHPIAHEIILSPCWIFLVDSD